MPSTKLQTASNMSAEFEQSPLLNVEVAAALLQIEVSTLYKYTSKRLIPHYKRAGKLLFNRAELLEWVEQGRRPVIDSSTADGHLLKQRGGK